MQSCGGADKYMTHTNAQSHRHSYTQAWVVNKGSDQGQALPHVRCQIECVHQA